MKLGIVIPTRNRATHAIAAIRSLLDQERCDLNVVVSDNSSSSDDVRHLASFCRGSGDPRLLYVRPPEILPMPHHWDWAVEQALARTDATHLGVHYDRKLWRPDSLRILGAAAERRPELMVTYAVDHVFPVANGIIVWQFPTTGRLYEIRTEEVIRVTASCQFGRTIMAFPMLSNCIVPRAVLERIRLRFGSICASDSPDSAFIYRSCAVEERYLHLDRSMKIAHSFGISNSLSFLRNEPGGTFGDYRQLWGNRDWLVHAPIPGLNVGQNAAFHEYGAVQRVVGDRYPPLDRAGYLRELASTLPMIADSIANAETRAVLERHGWRPDAPQPLHRRIVSRIARTILRPARFSNEEQAIQYLLTRPPLGKRQSKLLAPLQPVEMPFPR